MTTAILSPAVRRFAWKEYRTLRGLWVAVFGLGLLIDWLTGALLAPPVDFAGVRLAIALAAAALYAAGAAAILFSMEHEENTYDFLRGLPATWQPVFFGKFALAALSSLLLATALAIVGLWAPGLHFGAPTSENASLAFGILGVAILEALAWGTLWSMIMKRPLAAAVVTLFVASLAANCAVGLVGNGYIAPTDLRAYITAIPLRLAIVLAVLGTSVFVARSWLGSQPEPRSSRASGLWAGLSSWWNREKAVQAHAKKLVGRPRRRSMMLRLLWQTWRDAWKLLLLPVVLAGVCLFVTFTCEQLWNGPNSVAPLIGIGTVFYAPAMYGALAFAADQRRGSVRFLAEHGAAPRYVWLSRHIVWLGTLGVLVLLLSLVLGTIVVRSFYLHRKAVEFRSLASATLVWSGLATWGVFTAYALGQLCSMTLKSEILASFVAFILATILAAWVAAIVAWDLSAWLFLMPLAIALMVATWLRAPDWVAGRSSWRAWVWPGVAIMVAVAVTGVLLPVARLEQVRRLDNPMDSALLSTAVEEELKASNRRVRDSEAARTAEMYLQAANLLTAPTENSAIEPWLKPEYMNGPGVLNGPIDTSKIPAEQKDAFNAAMRRWGEQIAERREEATKLAIEASKRPSCQFEFHSSPAWKNGSWAGFGPNYQNADFLVRHLAKLDWMTPGTGATFDELLAALKLNQQMRAGQHPTIVFHRLEREREILKLIGEWAFDSNLTNEERGKAIEALKETFVAAPSLIEAVAADDRSMRRVIREEEAPIAFSSQPIPTDTYLAYLANKLPWERERALVALDLLTSGKARWISGLDSALANKKSLYDGNNVVRSWFQSSGELDAFFGSNRAAATSYLLATELRSRTALRDLLYSYLDTKAWQNATLLEIALAMYRHDHDEYPDTLARLVPEYLAAEPLDPYALQPFSYEPRGLDDVLVYQEAAQQGQVAAHATFFWSVGLNGWQLQRSETLNTVSGGTPTTEAAPGASIGDAAGGPAGGEDELEGPPPQRSVYFAPTIDAPMVPYSMPPLVFVLPSAAHSE